MPALHRTIAFADVNRVAVQIGEYLHLYVPCGAQEALDVDATVAENQLRRCPRVGVGVAELMLLPHDCHAAAATSRDRLDDDRIPDVFGERETRVDGGYWSR